MNIALIGFGVENQAVYRYLSKNQAVSLTICDQNPNLVLPEGSKSQLGANYLENIDTFDLIVRSVGIHPSVITNVSKEAAKKLTTAVNMFFQANHTPVIGVTGTKGKGTTSTLIHKILEAAGKKSVLAGNIGVPMLDVLDQAQTMDFVVLELSSFQLYDATYSPHIAVCLMVVPEHLNWHSNMEDYIQAKAHIFKYQKSDDVAVYNAFNTVSDQLARLSPAQKKLSYAVPGIDEHVLAICKVYVEGNTLYCDKQPVCQLDQIALPGRHNLENISAAIAATWDLIGGNVEVIRTVLASFKGLPYRLEHIKDLEGVQYYNDSFATTPEATIAALQALKAPKILIAGGRSKGVSLEPLANAIVGSNVKTVLCIGEEGRNIAVLLQTRGFTNFITEGLQTMPMIIEKAHRLAEQGDIVLLSAGLASFDMFKDYKDRGDQFNAAVQSLVAPV
jgi:UDP-N-acetylmuramoylalanine--D-glutamate ligase